MRVPVQHTKWILCALALALLGLVAWLGQSDSSSETVARGPHGGGQRTSDESSRGAELELAATGEDDAPARNLGTGAARALRGRVVEANSGEGLADFAVTVLGAEGFATEVSSDERGRFLLDVPQPTSLRLRVACPYGWITVNAPSTVEPNAQGEYDEIVLRARAAGFAPLRVQLVDERTLEPVPFYLVRVGTRNGSRAEAWSDAQGVLSTDHELGEGTLLLFGYDSRHADAQESKAYWYREFEHHPLAEGATPETLPIPVGPTYRLELDAPREAPLERLAAVLTSTAPSHASAGMLQWSTLAYLRSRDGWWVRFPPRMFLRDRPGVLTLLSADGRWWGEGQVSTRQGIDPRMIAVRLERRAKVQGRTVDRSGESLANVHVALFGVDRSGEFRELERGRSSGNGLFEFTYLRSGRYVARAASPQTAAAQHEFTLSGQEDVEFEIVLDRVGSASIRGAVIAPDELGEIEAVNVTLRSAQGGGGVLETTAALSPGSRPRRFEFAFEDVSSGVYSVSASPIAQHPLDALTAQAQVLAPGPELTLELPRESEVRCVDLRAVDAKTGARLAGAQLDFVNHEMFSAPSKTSGKYIRCVAASPRDSDVVWVVTDDGYAPRFGALSELTFVNGEAQLELALERGWGARIEVLETDLTPAAGVDVLIDGERAARTDASGACVLQRATAPRSLELRRPGWRVELASQVTLRELARGESGFARLWIARE